MSVSREKTIQLAQQFTQALEALDEVEIFEEPATIRQEIFRILSELLREEEEVELEARRRIQSQRRIIPEGTPEWDILYRKYYIDLMKKFRVA
jgi:hypothetical protein